MKMRYFILLVFGIAMLHCDAVFGQSKCSYCGGTGKIVKNLSVSQYGVRNEVKTRCSECGGYFYPSSGHSHIHCKYCGGTGIRNSRNSSTSSDTYVADPQMKAWGTEMAHTIRYGLPMSDAENAAYNLLARTDAASAKRYMEWRNVLNSMVVYCNRNSALMTPTNVQALDNMYNSTEQKLMQCANGVALPQELKNIADQLYKKYKETFVSYRNYSSAMLNLQDLENRVIDWQLNQLMF